MRRVLLLIALVMALPASAHIHGRGVATPPPPGNNITLDNGNQLTDDAGNPLRIDP